MTTQQHPITPPPDELVQQWYNECPEANEDSLPYVATQAARWGADQELKACCEYLTRCAAWLPEDVQEMLDLRRPKPPTLNSIALQMLGTIERDAHYLPEITDTIRRALEQLDD